MIDFVNESTLSLLDAARLLGVDIATARNWEKHGKNGRRLDTCLTGGVVMTSLEAINRFSVQRGDNNQSVGAVGVSSPARISPAVKKELESLGIDI